MAGVLVQLLKNVLNVVIEGTTTAGVGELSNFIIGSIMAYTAGYVYFRKKTFNRAVLGLLAGTLAMTLVATISNYYIMFPLYGKLMGLDVQVFIDMGAAINKNIVDLKSMMILSIVPFNILKGLGITAITILIYKRVSPILHK